MPEASVRRRGTGDPEAATWAKNQGSPVGLEPVGSSSAGPANVSSFLGGTSSLLKRSPIPASPARSRKAPRVTPPARGRPCSESRPRRSAQPGGRSASGAERAEAMDGRGKRPATGHGHARSGEAPPARSGVDHRFVVCKRVDEVSRPTFSDPSVMPRSGSPPARGRRRVCRERGRASRRSRSRNDSRRGIGRGCRSCRHGRSLAG